MHERDWLGEEGADGIKLGFNSGDIEDVRLLRSVCCLFLHSLECLTQFEIWNRGVIHDTLLKG